MNCLIMIYIEMIREIDELTNSDKPYLHDL